MGDETLRALTAPAGKRAVHGFLKPLEIQATGKRKRSSQLDKITGV